MVKWPDIVLTVDGERLVVRTGEVSAEDAAAMRRETGMSLQSVLRAATEDPDVDVIAALVWLARRQAGTPQPFGDVARSIRYDTPIEADETAARDDADPFGPAAD